MFVGDISQEWRIRVREELARVVAFYSDRYDIVVPQFTMYFANDLEPITMLYQELHDREAPFVQGFRGGWVASTRDSALEAFVASGSASGLSELLSHEYYHMMQHHVLRTLADGPRSSTAWLIEGTASYGETLYVTRGSHKQAEFLWRWEPFARAHTALTSVMRNEVPFKELALEGVINALLAPHYYDFAAAAVAWLVGNSGRDLADVEYWRLLAKTDDSESAFAAAFGIASDDFVEAFESDRTTFADRLPQIGGLVVDLAGVPLAGVHIAVSPRWGGASAYGTSGEDGTFAITVLPEWEYLIRLGRVVGGSQFTSVFYGLNVDPRTGDVNRCGHTFIAVGPESPGDLVIKVLPELLERPDEPRCNEGVPGYYKVAMRFFGPDGEAIREPIVEAAIFPAEWLSENRGGGRFAGVGVDGIASRIVAEGSYGVQIYYSSGTSSWPIGWYGGESGFTTDRREATVFEVNGADVTDIEIHFRDNPADLVTSRP